MFKALFNIIINLLATIIQLICWPINQIISSALPDLSSKITEVTNVFGTAFDGMAWAVSAIPPQIVSTLLFIITIEIAKHTIFTSTHTLIKVWNVLQKLKFW